MDVKQKIKLNILCSAGYFYFGLILLFIGGVISFLVMAALTVGKASAIRFLIRIAIPLFILGWKIIKGFFNIIFTRLPEPDGITLNKKEYKEFYQFIDDIRRRVNCPKIHYIKINSDLNACIAEQPTLGIIGWYKRYLVIGFPLLLILEEDELKAVLAHECAHLSKAHGRSGMKIYRVKSIWEGIVSELKKDGKDKNLFVRIFVQRYIPTLNDMLFSMKKEHEYQADSIAASVVSPQVMADSLLKLNIYDLHLTQSFWPEIFRLNRETPEPPKDLYSRMEKAVLKPFPKVFLKSLVEKFLNYRSLPNSTHPSYIERIERLGVDIPDLKFTSHNSLHSLFLDQADCIAKQLSQIWFDSVKEGWKDYFNSVKKMKERLQDLEDHSHSQPLEEEEIMERAELIERLEGGEKAFQAFKEAKDRFPGNNYVDYNLGRLMLYNDNDEGTELLKQVMKRDYQMIPLCCYELVNYFNQKNEKDTAAIFYHYAVKFMKINEEVKKERNGVRFSDTFLPHDLSYETVQSLRTILLKYKEIQKVYVVRKYLKLSGQFPLYIIAVKYRPGVFRAKRLKIQSQIAREKLLLWDCLIVPLNGRNRQLEYIINSISESRIL